MELIIKGILTMKGSRGKQMKDKKILKYSDGFADAEKLELEELEEISGGRLQESDRAKYERKMRECQKKNMTWQETLDLFSKDLDNDFDKKQMEIWVRNYYLNHHFL